MARALGIIPARYGSSRFPGKPLASLNGKPLLQHVYERSRRAGRLFDVWVATDDKRIFETVTGFGGRALMTSAEHVSGSDRVAEVAAHPEASGAEIIVNIQGDQPLIDPEALDALVTALDSDPSLDMATLYEPLGSLEDLSDPNVAKVVADRRGDALYFSRSPIPHSWDGSRGTGAPGPEGLRAYRKHVGVYAFRKRFLLEFNRLERGPLEQLEGLEQLRVLEAGRRIRLVPCSGCSVSVETPGDLRRVEAIMRSRT